MLLVADSPNGELSLKLGMDAHLSKRLLKMLGDLRDTLQFVKRMVWFQLLNLKFFLTVLILLKNAKELLKEFSQLFSLPCKRITYFLKAAFLSQTWLLMDPSILRKKKIT